MLTQTQDNERYLRQGLSGKTTIFFFSSTRNPVMPPRLLEEDDCEDFSFFLFLCIASRFKVSRRDHQPVPAPLMDTQEEEEEKLCGRERKASVLCPIFVYVHSGALSLFPDSGWRVNNEPQS
jgi:hypothetical protein